MEITSMSKSGAERSAISTCNEQTSTEKDVAECRLIIKVVFGLFNLAESWAIRPILYWVPMYFVFKTLAIIWRKFASHSSVGCARAGAISWAGV
jgi:hypothetical protein